MRTIRTRTIEWGCRLLAVAGIWGAVSSHAGAQALTPMRDWTSSDGKVTRAELLVFQAGADNNTVRLRLKDGAVFKLGLDRFSREDQAVILKARLESQFRVRFNEAETSCVFHSNHLAADDWKERSWAFFGSDTDGSWLKLAIHSQLDFLSKGAGLVIIGDGLPLRIPFEEGAVRRGRRGRTMYERIEISLGEQSADFVRVLKHPDRLEFFLEIPGSDHQPIPLSEKEKQGLRAVGEAFETAASLSTDKTWWATLIGRNREELIAEEADRLRKFRDPEREALMPMRMWTKTEGDFFEAELLGFTGPDAVFRDATGELNAFPPTKLVPADLETLAIRRLESALLPSWHPVDDSLGYYWPVGWENDRRFRHPAVLFAIDKVTRKPRLVLQHDFEGAPELIPKAIELRGAGMSQGLRLPLVDPVKIRGGSGVRVWIPLQESVAKVLAGLIRESEGLDYILESSEEESQTGSFDEGEFAAAVEAVEIHHLFASWRSLREDFPDPADSPEENPSGESDAGENPADREITTPSQ